MYYTYVLKSIEDKKVYVGFTSKKPIERVREHNTGHNSWTKQNKPFKLIYFESYKCEEDVRLREKFYKTGFGKRLKKLIVREFDT